MRETFEEIHKHECRRQQTGVALRAEHRWWSFVLVSLYNTARSWGLEKASLGKCHPWLVNCWCHWWEQIKLSHAFLSNFVLLKSNFNRNEQICLHKERRYLAPWQESDPGRGCNAAELCCFPPKRLQIGCGAGKATCHLAGVSLRLLEILYHSLSTDVFFQWNTSWIISQSVLVS